MKKITAIVVITGLIFLAFAPMTMVNQSSEKAKSLSTNYSHTGLINLWVRRNGTDPGFPYPNDNQTAWLGANYFGTKTFTILMDTLGAGDPPMRGYQWIDLNDTSLFPIDSEIWIFDWPSVASMTATANYAKIDGRIRGFLWDDFTVGTQSPANMSAYYTAIHHEDANITQDPLKLILVVYNRNYMLRNPYAWDSIQDYFDGISFWLYPMVYQTLWQDLTGYEGAFMDLRSKIPNATSKTFWVGIYLHFYNLGDYPSEYIYEWMGIASRFIRSGLAIQFHVLENFWILNNPVESATVRDYVIGQFDPAYSVIYDKSVLVDVAAYSGKSIHSNRFQNITINNATYTDPVVQTRRTGEFINTIWNVGGNISFYGLPDEDYLVYDKSYGWQNYSSKVHITIDQTWNDDIIRLGCQLDINATLKIENCIIRFDTDQYEHSEANATAPSYGISLSRNGKLYIKNSTIEPTLRAYPYFWRLLNETPIANLSSKSIVIENSTIARWAGRMFPTNLFYSNDSYYFMPGSDGGNNHGLWFQAGGYLNELYFSRNHLFLWTISAVHGIFLFPTDMDSVGHFAFDGNEILGGDVGLWIDVSYGKSVTIRNLTLDYSDLWGQTSVRILLRVEGLWVTTGSIVQINWAIRVNQESRTDIYQSSDFSVRFQCYGLESGRRYYVFVDDDWKENLYANGGVIAFTYKGPWGDHDLEVRGGLYSPAMYGLIDIAFMFMALGLVVGVIGETTYDLRKQRPLTTEKMVSSAVHMTIYIVVGLILIRIVSSVVG